MEYRGDYDSYDRSDDEDEFSTFNTLAYILIAIDCHNQMFEEHLEGKSLFKVILSACSQLLDSQLVKGTHRGENRLAMVVVSNDAEKMTICNFKDNLPNVLKQLKTLCGKPDEELKEKYHRDKPLNFGEFVFNCRTKFRDLSSDYLKYIIYVSNDDNPVVNDDEKIFQAVNQAKVMAESNVKFELVTFKEEFQLGMFFQEFLDSCNCKFSYEYLTDEISLQDKLLNRLTLRGKIAKFFAVPSDTNSYMEVIEKCYIKPSNYLNSISVRRSDLREVMRIKNMDLQTNEYKVKYTKTDFISLNEEEKNIFIKDQILMGFTLIGTSSGLLEPGLHCKDPKFVQENKNHPNPLFNLLWDYCTEKNRTLICTRKYRLTTAPTILELSPCVINNIRSFLALGVPFFEDIKEQDLHNPLHEQLETTDDRLMEAAENFVTALNFDYDPLQIHDTVNCRKMEYVRSELLEEPPRPVPDVCDLSVVGGPEVDRAVENLNGLITVSVKRKAPPKQTKKAKK